MHALLTPSLWKWQGMIVGGVTILAMLGAPRLTPQVASPGGGLCGGLLAYFGLGLLDGNLLRLEQNPLVIGPLAETGGSVLASLVDRWRGLGLLNLATVKTLLCPRSRLSALLSIDTLKNCVVVDALTRSRHRSNRELVGQGQATSCLRWWVACLGPGPWAPPWSTWAAAEHRACRACLRACSRWWYFWY